MQAERTNTVLNYILPGLLISAAFTAVIGFLYMLMLFVQGALIFNRIHVNRWWTFVLEVFVVIHGTKEALQIK